MVGETSTMVTVVAGTLMVQLMIPALNLVPYCVENKREKEKEGEKEMRGERGQTVRNAGDADGGDTMGHDTTRR